MINYKVFIFCVQKVLSWLTSQGKDSRKLELQQLCSPLLTMLQDFSTTVSTMSRTKQVQVTSKLAQPIAKLSVAILFCAV